MKEKRRTNNISHIQSHGSDRSTTPVDLRTTINLNEESQKAVPDIQTIKQEDHTITNCQKHFNTTYKMMSRPKILQFIDNEDIGSLSPEDENKLNPSFEDDDDKSTICGSDHGEKDDNDPNPSVEIFQEVIYHQPPKAADRSAAKRLARRLYQLSGFKMSDVSKHLSKK